MVKCAVPFCSSRDEDCKYTGISFHRFPIEMNMRRLWAHNIGRPDWFPTPRSRVCSLHFTADSYNANKRLDKNAAPSVFMQNIKEVVKRKNGKKREVYYYDPAMVRTTVEYDIEDPEEDLQPIPHSHDSINNIPSAPVVLKPIVRPSVKLEPINEPTMLEDLESINLPSTSICSEPSVPITAPKKVFLVRGLGSLKMDSPKKATLLDVIREEKRKNAEMELKLKSLKRKYDTLNNKMFKLKQMNKFLIDKYHVT